MKKILFVLAAAIMSLTASAASNVEKIQFANKGDFALGAMVGLPVQAGLRSANMPFVSLDGMWGLKDGFANTKTFGQNGAVDLGVYVGFCQYGDAEEDWKTSNFELPIVARSAFHWEFVKKLDVYMGFQGGIALWHWMTKDKVSDVKVSDTSVDGVFGMYGGAKWMFTNAFGVKLELSGDWVRGNNLPILSGGVQFNF